MFRSHCRKMKAAQFFCTTNHEQQTLQWKHHAARIRLFGGQRGSKPRYCDSIRSKIHTNDFHETCFIVRGRRSFSPENSVAKNQQDWNVLKQLELCISGIWGAQGGGGGGGTKMQTAGLPTVARKYFRRSQVCRPCGCAAKTPNLHTD